MKVLVSGFEPFLGNQVNISQQVIESLCKKKKFHTVLLPVEFEIAFKKIRATIQDLQPNVVIMMGMARNRTKISFEKVALNWVKSEYPDNAKICPSIGMIDPDEEMALMTKLNWNRVTSLFPKEMVEISFSAGTYVCNDLYFRVLSYLKHNKQQHIRAGFIHLPAPRDEFTADQIEDVVIRTIEELI